ncbi:DUF4097 domain-containing protein [Nonomuraea sp. KC401]|uniref:DUF4097 family beta strand repeat-containing protein n=1 Tax=unclassified Nonomuraea TaxID=2593643 RepID=UPI0010FCE3B0|nr:MULTISPECIES: DUF4097 family beta strand repeat-containing protein [unclassified Nonomuraea]NBE95583.1 DUF4097 family beta strand repeat protein [Nonomuraea sp. K271]TLF48214.1 DUF4097 domain-containing protein [Nonomuraea sp. KC401]
MKTQRTAVTASLLALVAVLTGCGSSGSLDEAVVSYDVTDKVAALHVGTDAGTVEVVQSDRRGIRVTERLTWRKNKPETSHKVKGDTLELTFACPTTWGWGAIGDSCDVNYQVEVPEGLQVKVSSDSGTLTLKNLSGDVDALTDSGTIGATGLTGRRVVTRTDSGDTNLAFTGRPDQVTTTTDSGRTVIEVPRGPYNIVARTDNGDKDIKAPSDPSAQRTIELNSDSGDLAVVTP